VNVAGAGDERHRIPGDRWELGHVEADRAVERLIILDVKLQLQTGEISYRQVL
jgi:hypothetical protein